MKTMMPPVSGSEIRRSASTFAIFEGILFVVFGLAALCFPAFAGVATAVLFGWILVASGIAGLAGAFAGSGHTHFWWSVFSGVLAIVAGLVMAFHPFAGAMALVFVVAAWLFFDGISSLMIAFDLRRSGQPSWGWPIVSGIVDWLLAVLIFFLSPLASLLAVGVIVGIDLVVGGSALIGIGWGLRSSANRLES